MEYFCLSKLSQVSRFPCNDFQFCFHHFFDQFITKSDNMTRFAGNPIVRICDRFQLFGSVTEQKILTKNGTGFDSKRIPMN